MITIYTDGSSKNNNQNSGFSFIVFQEDTLIDAYNKQESGTNNEMELKAIICACQYVDRYYPNEPIIIYSDSSYCVNAINNWMYTWVRNNWINSKKEQVKNLFLMKILYSYFNTDFYHCQIKWNKGHNGILGNELADAAATLDSNKFYKLIQENNIKIDLRNQKEKIFDF